ncbi:MAG: flagellar type III secretion system pore protein FliP [Candidatus Sumerlaeia bacterium]
MKLRHPILLSLLLLGLLIAPCVVFAQPALPIGPNPPSPPSRPLSLNIGGLQDMQPQQLTVGIQLLILLTVLSLVPAILVMLTSFVRIVVVLGFIRRAMATPEVPPNQVLLGLALFLTLFVMAPTFTRVNDEAVQPYLAGQLTPQEAYTEGMKPVREFLFYHTRKTDLALFVGLARMDRPQTREDIPNHVLIPSFLISELKTALIIGFVIYIPFLIIDMVVASVLLSMGMMMMPPVAISLPFKVLLFVLVDGWNLVIGSLMRSFG